MVKDKEQLREQLRFAKNARNHEKNLTQKREELDQLIIQAQLEYDNKKLQAHRLQEYAPDQAKTLLQEIERKELMLNEMNDKKKEVDALLDSYDAIESIEVIKRNLANTIMQEDPQRARQFEILQKNIEHYQQRENESNEAIRLLDQIKTLLDETVELRKSIRRRGLLSYIFGVNPTFAITQRLQAMGLLIKNHLPFFDNKPEVKEFLTQLAAHAEKRWGFRHLDTFLPESEERIEYFIYSFKQSSQEQASKRTIEEVKLDEWLNL